MKNLKRSSDHILEDGIYLPSFLFLEKEQQENTISPVSSFNPAGAFDDSAFQSSISPAQNFIKKKIIIDKDSFGFLLEEAERIAFLKRLQVAGFTIFFRGAEDEKGVAAFSELKKDFSNIGQLKNISQFNHEVDREEIKKLGIARDEILLLDAQDWTRQALEIESAFSRKKNDSHTDTNDWNTAFSDDLISNFVPPLPSSYDDPKYLQKMAFVLDRSMAIDNREEIEASLGAYFGSCVSAKEVNIEGLLTLALSSYNMTEKLDEFVRSSRLENSLGNLVFRNIFSNKEFFAATEIFPHRHFALEGYLENLLSLDVIDNYGKYPELIEKLPDRKEQLISRIEHESKDSNLAQISGILAAILRGKEEDSIQKFQELVENLDIAENEEETILLTLRMSGLFARAAHNNIESSFFDEQLLQNIILAIDPTTDRNFRISQDDLDKVVLGLNPQNIAKIADLIFSTNQDFLSEKIVIAAIGANPQMSQQLVKTYCEKGDADIDSKKRVICSLPSRMVQNFLHGKVINSSDQFLLLEDWLGLKSSDRDPKHTTYIQSYNASGYAIGETKEWIEGAEWRNVKAKNIVAAKITSRDDEFNIDDVKSLIKLALAETEIKHFAFSSKLASSKRFSECLGMLDERGVTHEVTDYENYWGIGNLIRESAVKVKSEIRIAFNGLQDHIAVDNSREKPSYNMGLAGEVLNGSSQNLQIRTAVIDSDITHNLLQQEYKPQHFDQVTTVNILDKKDVSALKNQVSDQHIFCKFQQSLKANIKSRLLSVDDAEDFYGLVEDQSKVDGVTIFKGDDGFFYAQSEKDCDLDYVIKAPNPNIIDARYSSLPKDDPIRTIIDEYRDPEKGFSRVASYDKEYVNYDPADHTGSMERMFDERLGSCRHRAAAVLYKIRSSLPKHEYDRCRMVGIDNNHVVLEIKSSDDKWVKADLGGGENYQLKTLKDSVRYEVGKSEVDVAIAPPKFSKKKLKKSSRQQEYNAQQEEVLPAQQMLNVLSSLTEFSKVTTTEKLTEAMANKSKFLIVAANVEDNANFLLSEAATLGREVFYIDDPKKAELHKMNLQIENNGTPLIAEEGQLFDFLQRAKSASGSANKPLLLINWDAFDIRQKVAMNTILDQERMILDVAIDDSIQVVGFSSKYPKDTSFIFRHEACVVSEISPKTPEEQQRNLQIIDLEGFSNWRSKLFGNIVLLGEKMVWQKSDFTLALERGEKDFKVINLSPEHEQELQYELKQAVANGKFVYHGYEIAVAKDLEVASRGDNAFAFSKFNDVSQISVQKYSDMPQDATLINNHLFDLLISDKEIENGLYCEKNGLIKQASEGEKLLKLFISSELSEGQWYCLFNEAQKHDLKLELYLNYGVELPHEVKARENKDSFDKKEITARIICHDDAEAALESVKKDSPDIYAVVDVEDFSYQDLVEKIDFETTKFGFRNFRKVKSEIVERLESGEKIILKGKFSEGLFNSLAPLFFSDLGRNLIVISEESMKDNSLSWLYPEEIWNNGQDVAEGKFSKLRFEEFKASTNLQNSEEEAQRFIEERKNDFIADLQQNNMLRLVGHSGVGKSSLLREFEKDDQDTLVVYRELGNFEKWALGEGAGGKTKILFIDESNMENLHLTMFSPLKKKGQQDSSEIEEGQRIFYKQKFYELDENHKVIFACNPSQYSGGRFEQKLFDDGTIPAVELRDFPPSYIYERILKKTIYENLAPEIQEQISEQTFKEECAKFIEQYQQTNAVKDEKEGNVETVRELQENVLRFIEIKTSGLPNPQINDANFVSTAATKEVEESFALSLRIRQKQYEGKFPQEACGLNAVLLNGDSGTGKSVLIKSVLQSEGLEEIKFDPKDSAVSGRGYYKIGASLSLQEKKKIITKAFEEGNIVWIDELNSCIDDGLEKVLNAVLTGEHPDGKQGKAGFMLVSSVNSATELEGRSIISPALRHRMAWHDVKSLKDYDEADLTKIIKCWLKDDSGLNSVAQDIAKDFAACLNYRADTDFNLRMLKMVLPDLMQYYAQEPLLQNADNVISTTVIEIAAEQKVESPEENLADFEVIEDINKHEQETAETKEDFEQKITHLAEAEFDEEPEQKVDAPVAAKHSEVTEAVTILPDPIVSRESAPVESEVARKEKVGKRSSYAVKPVKTTKLKNNQNKCLPSCTIS